MKSASAAFRNAHEFFRERSRAEPHLIRAVRVFEYPYRERWNSSLKNVFWTTCHRQCQDGEFKAMKTASWR
jgi:trehalose-6-phosphate synthase